MNPGSGNMAFYGAEVEDPRLSGGFVFCKPRGEANIRTFTGQGRRRVVMRPIPGIGVGQVCVCVFSCSWQSHDAAVEVMVVMRVREGDRKHPQRKTKRQKKHITCSFLSVFTTSELLMK